MNKPDWFLENFSKNYIEENIALTRSKQKARQNIQLDDENSKIELAKKMINPFNSFYRVLKLAINISVDVHHNSHASFILTITPNYVNIEKL